MNSVGARNKINKSKDSSHQQTRLLACSPTYTPTSPFWKSCAGGNDGTKLLHIRVIVPNTSQFQAAIGGWGVYQPSINCLSV